ncbi:hypothetical protein NM688_g6602 [Phlebia brevispora]|uniref:Uncharacterized protein n=1 Tax=Phlebia brevispora TaxID=194682 RepID=A0ACC1SEH1_9APHY|nr:hypothetical protein NM688_g6602 [Phlebia brevispora]
MVLYGVRNHGNMQTDVFIAGSGPIGAVYARKCVDAGLRVIMVEVGAADSMTSKPVASLDASRLHTVEFPSGHVLIPGYHKKNQIDYQKDIDRFVNTVSIPTSNVNIPTVDPDSFQATADKPFLFMGRNPAQNPFENLGAEAVTRGVGGMSTHWTCATPRLNPLIERPILDKDAPTDEKIWDELYTEAEDIIGTSRTQFDKSIRQILVLNALRETPNRTFDPLPLACHRLADPGYVEWHATDRILEELFTDLEKSKRFTLMTNHICTKVSMVPRLKGPGGEQDQYEVGAAEVLCLLPQGEGRKDTDPPFYITAKAYVIACGAVGTAQVLANSQRPEPLLDGENEDDKTIIETPLTPNLGSYITEQPMTFCQVVLNADIIAKVDTEPHRPDWWVQGVEDHIRQYPQDPIHIPFRDPEPQITSPFSIDHPWHTQIHRDAFSYGAVAENIDPRLIVDFRFFGYVDPSESNKIVFQKYYSDAYDMPQPTFKFQMSSEDRKRARRMMDDMCKTALKIGGYLPGSEPQFMTPGLALHLAGTVRAGDNRKETVADTYCKVWNFDNLYVGGNGVIPTGFAANPTLTSICYALRGASKIVEKLNGKL